MPLQVPKCDICSQSEAQVTCTFCEANFCSACDQKTHIGKLKSHQRVPCTGTDVPSRFCSVTGHEGQTLPIYCQTCLKPVCGLCGHGEHKTHQILPLKSAIENLKSRIKENLQPLQANVTKIDQEIKAMEDEKKRLEEEAKKLEEKIKKAKKRRIEETQKIEDLKSWVNKTDIDPFVFLSLVSELKLEQADQKTLQRETVNPGALGGERIAKTEERRWSLFDVFQHKAPIVRVNLTDEDVKLTIPTPSVIQRLQEVANSKNLQIEFCQDNSADATIVLQSYIPRPREAEVRKKLSKYSGEKIVLYLQLNKDSTRRAAPDVPLVSDIPGVNLFHFIGDRNGLHPTSNWQIDQELALIQLLSACSDRR